MTEKQRWMINDLNTWQKKQMERIGVYGPHKPAKEPADIRAARRASAAASAVIRKWENEKKTPWHREKTAIETKAQAVRRVILFEKTDAALAAIRTLKP